MAESKRAQEAEEGEEGGDTEEQREKKAKKRVHFQGIGFNDRRRERKQPLSKTSMQFS